MRRRHGERRSRGSVVYVEPLDDVVEESPGSNEEDEEVVPEAASGTPSTPTRARTSTKHPDVRESRRSRRSLGGEPVLPAQPKKESKRPFYVTKGFALPESRILPGVHVAEYRPERQACVWCRFRAQHGELRVDRRNPSQTNLYCHACNVPLCCNKHRPTCFLDFHVMQKQCATAAVRGTSVAEEQQARKGREYLQAN